MSFQLAPKIFRWAELTSQFFCKLDSSKYFTCPSGKLRTEFTSPIAKSTSPGLSETAFFARCHASKFLDHAKKSIGLDLQSNNFAHAFVTLCCPTATWNFLISLTHSGGSLGIGDQRILCSLRWILQLTFCSLHAYDYFLFRHGASFETFSCNVTSFSCY